MNTVDLPIIPQNTVLANGTTTHNLEVDHGYILWLIETGEAESPSVFFTPPAQIACPNITIKVFA